MMKGIIIAMMIATATAENMAQFKIMTGTYYDYMVIETMDGNEWLLDDEAAEDNPYMVYNPKYQEYTSIFQDGELVQVLFDTMGTETLEDDVILTVRSIDSRYR